MASVNYVIEHMRFIEYASDNSLTANERLLWYAMIHIANQRANGSDWPEEFIPITNKRLLSYVPFTEDTLIKARARLIQRNPVLVEYVPGKKNTDAPRYRLHYLSTCYPQNGDPIPGENRFYPNSTGNMQGNMQGNTGGNTGVTRWVTRWVTCGVTRGAL